MQLLERLGGEAACRQLSTKFYGRVDKDPVLRPFFPGKSRKCAIEALTAFLIQFLGGDEEKTQRRWWVSLRESHARFAIAAAERSAWLKQMRATLDEMPLDEDTRRVFQQFFEQSSSYLIGEESCPGQHSEMTARWTEQVSLDDTIAAIADGRAQDAIAQAPSFAGRPSVFVGILARMVRSGNAEMVGFVTRTLQCDVALTKHRYAGRTLLHFAAAAGCLEVVMALLRAGVDPEVCDSGGHTALYFVANECGTENGKEVVAALVRGGANVNACGGVTRATPLHMAARRGHVRIAETLLEYGARLDTRDAKGDTPLDRARNCRKTLVAQLLADRAAMQSSRLR